MCASPQLIARREQPLRKRYPPLRSPHLRRAFLLRRASEHERRKSTLETYFVDHQIEYKLNSFLNEMVASRPAQPLGWLARRMRREEAGGAAPVSTVPLLDPAVGGAAVGMDIEKQWAYSLNLGGESTPITGGGAQSTGINLTSTPQPASNPMARMLDHSV